jgi:transcriptional regulator with XRE-family HTH domain
MRSATNDVLPPAVRRALVDFGADISVARRRRGITTVMMAERLGVARTTYERVEQGESRVAIGTYMMTLFVLGLGTPIAGLVDPGTDEVGTLLDAENLPKRVRPKRDPQPK